jgi:MoaA/NifB/PqqE/SkfB family radical SAM enzyme
MTGAVGLAAHYLRHRFKTLHPFEVQAVLLNDCNLKCRYCRCPEMSKAQLSTDQWCDIVRRLAAAGTLRIKFQGGEPTLRKDFPTICRASKQVGIVTAVVTNGTVIAVRPSLLDHLDEVVVSMDALTQEKHDRYRGAGSHAAAMKALEHSAGRGRRTYVNMVVHRDTLEELDGMLAFCESRGYRLNAQAVMFGHEYQDARAEDLRLPETKERDMYRALADWARARRSLMFSAASYDRTARWADFKTLAVAGDGQSDCMAGKFYLHIEPNGDVHPCGLHTGTFTPKNILADGFEAALLHARHHDCEDCSLTYLNERKAVFGLKPSALLQVVRRG